MASRPVGGRPARCPAFRVRAEPASRGGAESVGWPDHAFFAAPPTFPNELPEPRLFGLRALRGIPDPSARCPRLSRGEGARLTSGPEEVIKRTWKEPERTRTRRRFRHEERTGGAAVPDRNARREAGAASGERGRRGDRSLAWRWPGPGTGARGGRSGGYRFCGGAVRPPAWAGPLVRRRRRSLSSSLPPGVRRSRPGSAPPGDGPHG